MSVLRLVRPSVFCFLKKETISTTSFELKDNDNKIRDAEITENDEDSEKPRLKVDLDTTLRYMKSEAYRITYGDKPVWHIYVRNFKGSYPKKTRETCIRGGKIATGSPCPICRDEYFLVDYRNIDLIKQFISPYGGNIIDSIKTGVCQKQHRNLIVAITKARNHGFLTFELPHRHYDYSFYKKL